jgi:hypothetical protein
MDITRLQTEVFSIIKSSIPPYVSLAEAISETLNISNDSAYRRIRGEKPVSIDELAKLAAKYKFSVDRILSLESDSYIFSGKLANANHLDSWLEMSLLQFENMAKYENAHIYYLAKDLPLAHFFNRPELASFKFFFWQKTILKENEFKGVKFKLGKMNDTSRLLAANIVSTYNKIHSSELWSTETVNSILRQIQYYHEAGIFENNTDPGDLCNSFEDLINHLERQAEEGVKFAFGKSPVSGNGKYYLYNNELIVGNNDVIADLGEKIVSYLNHSAINYVSTYDSRFNEYHLNAALNMISKSEQLHEINEKRRIAFFNGLRQKVDNTRKITS